MDVFPTFAIEEIFRILLAQYNILPLVIASGIERYVCKITLVVILTTKDDICLTFLLLLVIPPSDPSYIMDLI